MYAAVSVCPFPGLGTSAVVFVGVGDLGEDVELFSTEAKAFAVLVGLALGNEGGLTLGGVADGVNEKGF